MRREENKECSDVSHLYLPSSPLQVCHKWSWHFQWKHSEESDFPQHCSKWWGLQLGSFSHQQERQPWWKTWLWGRSSWWRNWCCCQEVWKQGFRWKSFCKQRWKSWSGNKGRVAVLNATRWISAGRSHLGEIWYSSFIAFMLVTLPVSIVIRLIKVSKVSLVSRCHIDRPPPASASYNFSLSKPNTRGQVNHLVITKHRWDPTGRPASVGWPDIQQVPGGRVLHRGRSLGRWVFLKAAPPSSLSTGESLSNSLLFELDHGWVTVWILRGCLKTFVQGGAGCWWNRTRLLSKSWRWNVAKLTLHQPVSVPFQGYHPGCGCQWI